MAPKVSKIYTRTGDTGESSLFGGSRVLKNHQRLEIYGTLDETNCHLGLARAELSSILCDRPELQAFDSLLGKLQCLLFDLGAQLACEGQPLPENYPQVTQVEIDLLERAIDQYDENLPPLRTFILPGGTICSAALHQARAVCRRAERYCIPLHQTGEIARDALIFLNRLSDLLFVLARWINKQLKVDDVIWEK